jgi:hypothetical protein
MNWEALGAVGEIVGAVAVVLTLGYLALQMRQNTAALRTGSREAVVSGAREVNRLRGEPLRTLAWARGLTEFPKLPFEDRNHFATIMVDEALFFQSTFALYESRQLEKSTYAAYLNWFAAAVATPGGSVWWETTGRSIFVPAMVAAVDERLAAGGLPDIRELPALRLDDPPAAQHAAETDGP